MCLNDTAVAEFVLMCFMYKLLRVFEKCCSYVLRDVGCNAKARGVVGDPNERSPVSVALGLAIARIMHSVRNVLFSLGPQVENICFDVFTCV